MTTNTETNDAEIPCEWTFAEAERPAPGCLRFRLNLKINTHRGVLIELDEVFDVRLPDSEAEMPLFQAEVERLYAERIDRRVKEALNRFVRREVESAGERADDADAPVLPSTTATETGGATPTAVVTAEKAEIEGEDQQLYFPEWGKDAPAGKAA
jgi:hypothetical protein